VGVPRLGPSALSVAQRLLWISLAMSVVTFVAYARDKSAAQRGARRTPEFVLHFLGALGGWPGAFVAQRILRHKTRKLVFQIVFWLTFVVEGGVVWWWASTR
jgi:uncharacterized membrane protein YsdA (DUF1294 family)